MADVTLHTSCAAQVTCVPNVFIDKYMNDANGEYVKLYLYLLRCTSRTDSPFSLDDIADRLDYTSRDIIRALKYWEKANLLKLEYEGDEIIDICLLDSQGHNTAITPVTYHKANNDTVAKATTEEEIKIDYSPLELAEFAENEEYQEVLYITQKYLKRPITVSESNYLMFWLKDLKLGSDSIAYLLETSIEGGHTQFKYMNKIAMDWAKEGVSNAAEAKAERFSHSEAIIKIIKAFGISGRTLLEDEKQYVSLWLNDMNMSLDVVVEACNRAAKKTGKVSFEYANTIIESWHQKSVKDLSDVSKEDAAFTGSISKKPAGLQSDSSSNVSSIPVAGTKKNQFNQFPQRNFDYDALEKKISGQ